MKCSLCEKNIWFWQDWDDDKNNGKAHKSCFEECKQVLELERKTAKAVKQESERLEQQRLDDAKKVREQIIKELDEEDDKIKLTEEKDT
jgi:hypothetical protein